MYNISFTPDRPLTYHLEDDQSLARLSLVPGRGGLVTNWTIQGQPVLYFDEERFQDPSLSVRGGIPILFPICGNLPHDQFNYDGKNYRLRQHGFARDLPWEVIGQQTQASAQLDLRLSHNDATLEAFPFEFELVFSYQLQGHNLRIEQRIANLGDQRMPFSLGLHPYFFCREKLGVTLAIPADDYLDQKTGDRHGYGGQLDLTAPELDLAFTQISQPRANFVDPDRNVKIEVSFSELYQTLVFWTVAGKDYLCLEPWSGPRNALNSGEQLAWVEPYSSRSAWVNFQVSME
ncbi:aldose epimerase [Synechocystis salina]|uniref:Aldose epimerase n=1 Tax=Synechocystis salina LEGE 00031 TaxID=1828736 RepID=A0ABR9VU17_9SYNC|nr:aldose epimerase [Synechocystis salina]MBE9240657.1 aldose epimerase [Synechocystis salina LEGE 00041]MBE9253943.1 aldose epimerase [Synechocystis salina LEGE 00031]